MKDNLATQYWHKICELEKKLNKVTKEVNQLKRRNAELREENLSLQTENAILKERLFGKKKKKKDDNDDNDDFISLRKNITGKKPRTKASYRREVPKEEEITETKEYAIDNCPKCGNQLIDKKEIERFIEDIPKFFEKIQKRVTKEIIESGYCLNCQERFYGKETNLQGQKVLLGNNVKLLIPYLNYVHNMTFQGMQDLIYDMYRLKISDGDVTNILNNTAMKLEDEHFKIREEIRNKASSNMDETSWRMRGEKYWAWVFTPTKGDEVSFEISNTRGKGVAEEIIGEDFTNSLTTDFYPAYDNLVENHQGCWVHLTRDFEALAKNKNFPKGIQKHLYLRYSQACKLYDELTEILEIPFDLEIREKLRKKFKTKILNFAKISKRDMKIKKLKNLKLRMHKCVDKLTHCIVNKDVEPHNNKGERAIKPIVIKRKISFGSRSDDFCKVLSINMSVLQTFWKTKRNNFFVLLYKLMFA